MPVLPGKSVVALEGLLEVPTTTLAVLDVGVEVAAGVGVSACRRTGSGVLLRPATIVADDTARGAACVGTGVTVGVGVPMACSTLLWICEKTTRLAKKNPTVRTPRIKMLVRAWERVWLMAIGAYRAARGTVNAQRSFPLS